MEIMRKEDGKDARLHSAPMFFWLLFDQPVYLLITPRLPVNFGYCWCEIVAVFILVLSIILVLLLAVFFFLVLTFLYVNVVQLMTTLSVGKSQKRSLCNVSSAVLQYQKQVTLQFTVLWVQCRMWWFIFRNTRLHRDTLVLFRFIAVRSPHSENNRST